MRASEALWSEVEKIYEAIITHPFIEELSRGTLDKEVFKLYVIQDALYLEEYARVLAALASKAPNEEWVKILSEDSVGVVEFEKSLHREYFSDWGLTPDTLRHTPATPTNVAYVNHLWRSVALEEFPVGLAAVTPCYWIYMKVGQYLEGRGSPDESYSKWISMYSSKEYAKYVDRILRMVDEALGDVGKHLWLKALRAFKLSAIYEYLFWDSAYRKEVFPFKTT